MKRLSLATALLAALAVVVAPAAAQELTGSWEITSEGRRGPQTMLVELVQDGSELSGTISMQMGGGRGGAAGRGGGGGRGPGAREIEVTDGSVDGESFTFTMLMEMGGRSISQVFTGTMKGDEIEGEIEGPQGSRPFTGKRSTTP